MRRPYVRIDNDEFWKEVGELSSEEYQASADVGKPASLEIAAKIKVDGSVLLLSGPCTVRHKKPRSTNGKYLKMWMIWTNRSDRSCLLINKQMRESIG